MKRRIGPLRVPIREAPVLDEQRSPGEPGDAASEHARIAAGTSPLGSREPGARESACAPECTSRREPAGERALRRERASRYEEDLMQPGEHSRVKEHTPRGVVPPGRREAGCRRALGAINRARSGESRKREGEVVHFSTTVHTARPSAGSLGRAEGPCKAGPSASRLRSRWAFHPAGFRRHEVCLTYRRCRSTRNGLSSQ